MLELYTHPMSPCAQKVRIVLAEKQLGWGVRHVDLARKENLRPEYLKLNPLGVVPTLVHDGKPVIESNIICEFVDDLYPTPSLRPKDPHAIASMRFWMKQVDGKLHPACGALQWPLIMRPAMMELDEAVRRALLDQVPEKPRRDRQKRLVELGLDAPDVVDAVQTYRKMILDMETVLQNHEWIVGDSFSLADVCLAPYFQTLLQFGWIGMYDDCSRVKDWFARCRGRASYEHAVASDFTPDVVADLRKKGEGAWPKIRAHLDGLRQPSEKWDDSAGFATCPISAIGGDAKAAI